MTPMSISSQKEHWRSWASLNSYPRKVQLVMSTKLLGQPQARVSIQVFPMQQLFMEFDATNVGSMHPGKKLQSLTKNIQPLTNNPQVFKPLQEKNLEDLDTKKKKNSLKPLTDAKLRKLSKWQCKDSRKYHSFLQNVLWTHAVVLLALLLLICSLWTWKVQE